MGPYALYRTLKMRRALCRNCSLCTRKNQLNVTFSGTMFWGVWQGKEDGLRVGWGWRGGGGGGQGARTEPVQKKGGQ